jgi:hypothetical protein
VNCDLWCLRNHDDRGWTIAFLILLAFPGVAGVFIAAADEYICFDRSPWWGPPEDPTSTCAGHFYESKHHVRSLGISSRRQR